MFRKIVMLLLAVLIFGAVECQGASDSKGKSKKSSAARQKKAKRTLKLKQQRIALLLQRELKKIHDMQERLIREKDDPERAKVLIAGINAGMKKITPHLKVLGNFPGAKFMTDTAKLVQEGKKFASEPDKVSDRTALELLHGHHMELIEAFRKKVSE